MYITYNTYNMPAVIVPHFNDQWVFSLSTIRKIVDSPTLSDSENIKRFVRVKQKGYFVDFILEPEFGTVPIIFSGVLSVNNQDEKKWTLVLTSKNFGTGTILLTHNEQYQFVSIFNFSLGGNIINQQDNNTIEELTVLTNGLATPIIRPSTLIF